jgi:large subunit ribosomal protein L18
MALLRKSLSEKDVQRVKRKARIRANIFGTTERPRLSVFKSGKHVYAQVIDDLTGKTLASASTMHKALRDSIKDLKPVDQAKKVGEAVAKACKAANVDKVVFDRGGFAYHGRVAALADAARESGLEF